MAEGVEVKINVIIILKLNEPDFAYYNLVREYKKKSEETHDDESLEMSRQFEYESRSDLFHILNAKIE
jgi:hypothetical protein